MQGASSPTARHDPFTDGIPDRAPSKAMRVAIVEDSAIIRSRLEEALGELSNVVLAGYAESELAALSLLAPGDWDLLILDLQLKDGNGLNVLKSLRSSKSKGRRRGRVAVFTNYAFPQYRDRSLALGADYFFDKARDLPRVLELVETLAGDREDDT